MKVTMDSPVAVQRNTPTTPSLLQLATDLSKPAKNPAVRSNPPQEVSEEEARQAILEFMQPTPGFVLFPTPPEDMAAAEQLVAVAPGSLGTYWVKTREAFEHCPNCGRCNNFLDVVKSALDNGTHTAVFLQDVLNGEYGYIVNSNPSQHCTCAECGLDLPLEATKFLATDRKPFRACYIYMHVK